MQKLGFVDYLENLTREEQEMILNGPVMNYIVWRVAWNKNSVTTPCRPVFDATYRTHSDSYALNDILPKGVNGMNNLAHIIIRWQIKRFAFHTDISKHYNMVKMNKSH